MIAELIAALVVAAAPATAQAAAPREPGKANAAQAPARTDGNVTARERARVAKAQNKDTKCGTKPAKETQKKAAAT